MLQYHYRKCIIKMLVEDSQDPSDQGSYHRLKTAQLPLSTYTCNSAFLQALCLLFSKHCGVLII